MGLSQRLSDGTVVYGVVGLGYVGLPLVIEMAKAGQTVIGMEINQEKVDAVNAGESYIPDVPGDELAALVASGLIRATTDFSSASECDVVAICVPSPLDDMKAPNVSYMVAATESIAPHIKPDTLVTLESTTYPGTTEEIVQPILERTGMVAGTDFYLAFSPERVDPGNAVFTTHNTPKIVGGVTPLCTEIATQFYATFLETVVPVSSTRTAEMTKLLENIFRCVNIALVNEMLVLSERMGVDIWEVVDAAKTKPFGFMPFYPGPGLGGHCIPIDPFYLSWKAREFDFHTEFIELAGKVNEGMPYYVVERLMSALNVQTKALSGSRVLVLGVAYKSDIDDLRESPALKVIRLLRSKGTETVYHDPYVGSLDIDGESVPSVELTADECTRADAILIITGHSNIDYELVVSSGSLVFDTRNVLKGMTASNVVRL
jgi:UDP-N-acetyl-D-glucosamine dehydrogenase